MRWQHLFSTNRTRSPRAKTRLHMENLEGREVPAALMIRSIDGTGNNVQHPEWGEAGSTFRRVAPAEYGDGLATPAGADRPSARVISNALADQADVPVNNERMLSAMVYAWGQFIDHDIDLTPTGAGEQFSIAVPTGDPYFDPNSTGTKSIPLTRSAYDPTTGTTNPRQQVNAITPWIDGSMVYGSDQATADSLRTFSGGQLKTSGDNLLPVNEAGFFLAGDVRVSENPELTSLHTIFLREHNATAQRLAQQNPSWSDEQLYQQARAWVIAEIQVITYKEWLPTVLGSNAVGLYRGYKANINPAISNEFATAAFRFGHSLLGDDIEFLGNNGLPIRDEVSLAEAFFNTSLVKENNVDPILKYLASDPSSELDTRIVDSVRNFLFGPPGAGGLDLASLNIQRGRDHGLADLNATRVAFGLPRYTKFEQITNDVNVQNKLRSLYTTVDNIDLWVGILSEKHVNGASIGSTGKAIISEQFNRLRDGDRMWYQRNFPATEVRRLNMTTLSDLIERNTHLTTIQPNAFVFRASITGTVFGDGNRNGTLNGGEQRFAGRTVRLLDADTGEVIATTTTNAQGVYSFDVVDGLRTGRYRVHQVLPPGAISSAPDRVLNIVSGETFITKVDLGSYIPPAGQQPPPPGNPPPPPPPAPGNPPPPPPHRPGQITLPRGFFLEHGLEGL